jgi:hypothetical protein
MIELLALPKTVTGVLWHGQSMFLRAASKSPLPTAQCSVSLGAVMRRGCEARLATLASVIAITIGSSSAKAEPTDQQKALALRLFDQGRSLLAGGKVAEACPKLEESRRLDPLPGTVLNLAVCHEKQGLAASAVAEFYEARAMAERDKRGDRVAFANEHLHALESQVSNLVIVVGVAADIPGLVVHLDGNPVGRAVWGTRIPVDPGEHTIEAFAPNKTVWKVAAKVSPAGDVQTVTLTSLEDLPPAPTPPPTSLSEPTSPVPQSREPQLAFHSPEHHGVSTRRQIALVSTGIGVVGLGIGSYFGALAFRRHGEPGGGTCTELPCDSSVKGEAASAADASTATFAAGFVGLAVGAILWFGDSSSSGDRPAVSVLPSVGPGRGEVQLSTRF